MLVISTVHSRWQCKCIAPHTDVFFGLVAHLHYQCVCCMDITGIACLLLMDLLFRGAVFTGLLVEFLLVCFRW